MFEKKMKMPVLRSIKGLFLLLMLLHYMAVQSNEKKHPIEFVVIIPSYNNENYYFRNLESVVNQQVDALFEIIYINDCSTDKTPVLVDAFVKERHLEGRVKVIHNAHPVGNSLGNLYNVIHRCADHKIIVNLDGDDFLAHDKVLARVAEEYKDPNVWMTYGQFMWYPQNIVGFCAELPQWVMDTNSFKKYNFVTTHLRTFKAGLFKRIKKEDLLYNGEFYPSAGDLAWVFPLLEMASKGHIRFIPDVLYHYNYNNPLCDHNKNYSLQRALTAEIYEKKPYEPLESLID